MKLKSQSPNIKKIYSDMQKETVTCSLCGSDALNPLFDQDRYGMGLQTVICTTCGFVFTNPRPAQSELDDFYQNHYRNVYSSDKERKLAYNPESKVYGRAEALLSFCRDQFATQPQSILEIGCEHGIFLHAARQEFKQAKLFGVEPNPEYAAFGSHSIGADIKASSIENYLANSNIKETHDFIVLNHVLEHLYEPRNVLLSLREKLTENGQLLIEVPNFFSSNWQQPLKMFHLAHVTHFGKETMQKLLQETGFEIVKTGEIGYPWAITFLCKKGSLPTEKNSINYSVDKLLSAATDVARKAGDNYEAFLTKKESKVGWTSKLKRLFKL